MSNQVVEDTPIDPDLRMTEEVFVDNFVSEDLMNGVYQDLDECYEAYNHYAYVMGFSVRKGKQYYFTKWYLCLCAGAKDEKSNSTVAYNKFDIRTQCKAKISFAKEENGTWKVSNFDADHNHVLALPHKRHFLRSQRRITKPTGNLLETFVNSGIKPVDGISYIVEESGGHQNAPFIPKDAYNYLQDVRKSKMEDGDVSGLFKYFRKKKEEDPLFEWDFDLDDDGRLANLFFRDGKSRLDYDIFNDVVSFDTTYRTNKYGLKCAIFVGVNNHWKNVILGCGFLSYETKESFEWLFGTFLRLMGGKEPETIFTDQAPAIISAVEKIFPHTRHRLCQWHISENANSNIGSLKSNSVFWDLIHTCYSGCDSEAEFEKTWSEIRKLDDGKNNWLDRLYGIRLKWSTAFNKDKFDGGIKSTQRSESTNRLLNGISGATTSLYDFVVAFERNIVEKWRENEMHDDYRCIHSRVPRANIGNPLLLHASQVYTHAIYKLFENELTGSLNYGSIEVPISDSQFSFEVYKKMNPEKRKLVLINTSTLKVRCSCKKFEVMGILCRHSLRVFDMKNVNKIPEIFVLKRWRKDARESNFGSSNLQKEVNEPDALYSSNATRYAYGVISKSRSHKEARAIVWKHLRNANKELNEFLKANVVVEPPRNAEPDENIHDGENPRNPLDPVRSRPKGEKNQRKKSYLEKQTKQSDSTSGKRRKVD